jgi:hypothetical protein
MIMNENNSKVNSHQNGNVTREQTLKKDYKYFTKKPKSKICFAILVHNNRELIKELINNVQFFCPNSTFVLFNGGGDPSLCDDLGVPVCPSSRKLKYGYTTIYFLETMEWIEELGIDYEYFINIDSDALFIKDGYENIISEQMRDADYMAVRLRIPGHNWFIGKQLRKDIDRWKELFRLDPYYGVFNVGQVIKRSLVKAILEPSKKEKYKNALLETISFGSDEIFFVNIAHELGFKMKKYPYVSDTDLIRYRPHFKLDEIIDCLNSKKFSGLCHPIHRLKNDQSRRLIKQLAYKCMIEQYRDEIYPWYEKDESNFAPSLPIRSKFGNKELIVRSGNTLTHYWENRVTKIWNRTITFAEGVKDIPIFHGNRSGNFEAACKLEKGGIGFWWRENEKRGYPWHGPILITQEDVEPILLDQLEDGRTILVCQSGDKLTYWACSVEGEWIKEPPLS